MASEVGFTAEPPGAVVVVPFAVLPRGALGADRGITGENEQPGTVKRKVKVTGAAMWAKRMWKGWKQKKSLGLNKAGKQEGRKENFYRNDKGKVLPF